MSTFINIYLIVSLPFYYIPQYAVVVVVVVVVAYCPDRLRALRPRQTLGSKTFQKIIKKLQSVGRRLIFLTKIIHD